MSSIIKNHLVRLGGDPSTPAPARASCSPAKEVRLLRADGTVRAIELRCSCGEVTVLELEFEPKETR